MPRRSMWIACRAWAALLALSTLAESRAVAAAPATDIEAHLAAGEFAPALRLARRAPAGAARNAHLTRVAVAQRAAGARQAALCSAAEIDDDLARADTLQQIASPAAQRQGGGVEPDFEALIELITSTIAPNTWADVGGPGAIDKFEGGVLVDAHGVLRPLVQPAAPVGLQLDEVRGAKNSKRTIGDPQHDSALRMVSLTRLEKAVQLELAAGRQPDETMQTLAGLQRVRYVLVYPAHHDSPHAGEIVLAGPAGAWQTDTESRIVGRASGAPVLRLDDLVTVFRAVLSADDARFGCSINPTADGLARTRTFLDESARSPLKPHQRKEWLERLRAKLGPQEIDVYGIDPRTHAARVLVEADYRMKLVGMGLEEPVAGVRSYLDLVKVPAGEAPPPLDVLRWWFTLNYQAVLASNHRDVFEIRGQGVQVLSENELLTQRGERVHTGKSDELNQQFAQSFTQHFPALCARYPVYAELRNIFDLALVAALLSAENLPDQTKWHLTCFGDPSGYQPPLGPAPRTVDSVLNHRVINKIHILAGVSGGVRVDPARLATRDAIELDKSGKLQADRAYLAPRAPQRGHWWWDAGE